MIGTKTFSFSRWPEAARWGACFALAIAFHAAGAAALFARWTEDSNLVASTAVIMVDLAPVAVSPNITTDVAPGPLQQEAEPEVQPEKPIEKIELPPDPQAEPVVAMPPPKPVEQPKEKKPKQKHASLASMPSRADQQANQAAAPMPGASSRNSDARRTGRRSSWPRLSAKRDIHRRHTATRAPRSLPSTSIVRATCITRASHAAPAPASSTTRLSRWSSAHSRCRRRPLKFRARKFRSLSRSATTRAERSKLGRCGRQNIG